MFDNNDKSVLGAMDDLQFALEANYGRFEMAIHLEPEAFMKFAADVSRNEYYSAYSRTNTPTEIVIAGPCGWFKVIKDDSLGS